jgi:universal stress protein A
LRVPLPAARSLRIRFPESAGGAPHQVDEVTADDPSGLLRESSAIMSLPRNVLVPVDLDDSSAQVLDYAVALATKLGATLHALHVVPWPLLGAEIPIGVTETAMDDIMRGKREAFDQLVAAHTAELALGSTLLKTGDARTAILAAAAELGADLIVMGTHGRRGVSRLVLGSVAESVARTAPCPVLLVRSGLAT